MEEEEWLPEVFDVPGNAQHVEAIAWHHVVPRWEIHAEEKDQAVVEEYISLEQRAFERGMKEGFKLGLSYNKELVI